MTLSELLKAVDFLNTDELRRLKQYIAEREETKHSIDELDAVLAELREGFNERDLDELEWAMNVE